MLPKMRSTIGRTRTTPRSERRTPASVDTEAARLAAARRIAERFVVARWPILANHKPVVTVRIAYPIDPDLLHRLGIDPAKLTLPSSEAEYTFTFADECDLGGGVVAPLVASVTIDSHQRIVKTTSSK